MGAELSAALFITHPVTGDILGIRSGGAEAYFANSPAEAAALASAVANGLPTYPAAQVDTRAGTGTNVALQLLLATQNYPRGFVLGQVGALEVTACSNSVTGWTAADNGSGAVRLTSNSAIAHGLTAASNGRYVRMSAATGLPAGLYRMTWVSTTAIDLLDVAFPGGGLSTPVMVKVGNPITLMTVVVPAGVMGPHGLLEYDLTWEASNNATAKFGRVTFGGSTAVTDLSFNSVVFAEQRVRIANQALNGLLAAAQRCSSRSVLASSVIGNVTPLAIDTLAADVTSLVQAQVTAPDEYVRLSNGKATLFSTGA